MAQIVSIRHHKPGHAELWEWLGTNMGEWDYILSRTTVTFKNDEDALVFCLKFNIPNATYSPDLINRKRE